MAAAESSSSVVSAEALTYTLCLKKIELILKEERKLAIFSLFSGRDVFVWLPTGFWKSICFQMLRFLFYRRHTWLGFLSKKNKKRLSLYSVFM